LLVLPRFDLEGCAVEAALLRLGAPLVRVSRGLNASNVVEIVTRLVFLFLHSGEGKKCFHCCAKIILRNCWRLLGDTEQILASESFRHSSLPTAKQAMAAHKSPQRIYPRPARR
jgi:hypothetical protein